MATRAVQNTHAHVRTGSRISHRIELAYRECPVYRDGTDHAISSCMTPEELKSRTMQFALNVITLVQELPAGAVSGAIGRQLVDSATSVASNYRASCRAKSPADFISKMTTVEEEADESEFWLDVLMRGKLAAPERTERLRDEAQQLTAIIVASIKTAKRNHPRR